MPPPQLPRVEELEFWTNGEKARYKDMSPVQDTVTISQELYERVFPHGVPGSINDSY